jgi:hypothetical protein
LLSECASFVPTLVVAILQLVFMQQSTTRKPNIL